MIFLTVFLMFVASVWQTAFKSIIIMKNSCNILLLIVAYSSYKVRLTNVTDMNMILHMDGRQNPQTSGNLCIISS